ncbi:N-acetylneuraminate synthase family protein [Candidatus Pelagibacter sp.]|nr:N-acetylneuraminate synthase family protein [Candidatus Pelagibacter sp.]
MKTFKTNFFKISSKDPTYFIADIAANHDGNLSRAKKLIRLCARAGANAAKFQHFKAKTIVSDFGFKNLKKMAHQKKWKKNVFDVYKKASINFKWTSELAKECKKNKIDFMTAPYDLSYVDKVNNFICAYKIGSGDITWHEIIEKIAKKNKLVMLATGASKFSEVKKAVKLILNNNKKLVLMQCNTNYTAKFENYQYINLKVIKSYKKEFKNKIILGLSDHTFGSQTVLGAVSMGVKVVEKHFTDDNNRDGPDHKFSMNPRTWKQMVSDTRILEASLGNGKKIIEKNEIESSVVQRRAIRAKTNLPKGTKIKKNMMEFLRPCPKNAISPFDYKKLINKKSINNIKKGDIFTWKNIK